MPLVIKGLDDSGQRGGVGGYSRYGLGFQSGHWAQIGSASLCSSTVLVSTRLMGISRNNSFIGSHAG